MAAGSTTVITTPFIVIKGKLRHKLQQCFLGKVSS